MAVRNSADPGDRPPDWRAFTCASDSPRTRRSGSMLGDKHLRGDFVGGDGDKVDVYLVGHCLQVRASRLQVGTDTARWVGHLLAAGHAT
jgi:hypothetical protein